MPALQEEAIRAIVSASEKACRPGTTCHDSPISGWLGRFLTGRELLHCTKSRKGDVSQIHPRKSSNIGIMEQEALETARTASEMAEGKIIDEVVGKISRIASKSPASAALLFSLVRQQKPANCVEMGTCVRRSRLFGQLPGRTS